MNRRLEALEKRRQALLNRCEEQRLELAYRVAQIRPSSQLTAWSRRAGSGGAGKNPLTWIAALAGLLIMLRRRRVLSGVGWATGLFALASRATTLLRVIAQLRTVYLSMKAARRPEARS